MTKKLTPPTDLADRRASVVHAAVNGTYRDVLTACVRRLAAALDDERTQPRDLSPLVLRLREFVAELAALDEFGPGDLAAAAVIPDAPFDPEGV